MTLHYDLLGCGEPLVMLHGWGMHGGIWQDFALTLAQDYQVINLDLPGHGCSEALVDADLQAIANALLAALPCTRFKLLGWSLGGLIALEMARLAPERVVSICLLAGNPCFVAQPDWPGIRSAVLEAFAAQLRQDASQTLVRFLSLQVQGLPDAKQQLQRIRQAVASRPAPVMSSLESGLEILKHTDLRSVYAKLGCPIQAILGGKDALVPVKLADALSAWRTAARVEVIKDAGHAPFISHPESLRQLLRSGV